MSDMELTQRSAFTRFPTGVDLGHRAHLVLQRRARSGNVSGRSRRQELMLVTSLAATGRAGAASTRSQVREVTKA